MHPSGTYIGRRRISSLSKLGSHPGLKVTKCHVIDLVPGAGWGFAAAAFALMCPVALMAEPGVPAELVDFI